LAGPEYALANGADAVLTYLIIGTGDMEFEAHEISRNAQIARECERLGVPLIVESLTRGKGIERPAAPEHVRLHTRIAAELGADLIKTEYTGDPASMAEVVKICPLPVLVLGGARKGSDDDSLEIVHAAVRAGAAGVFFGRSVFQSPNISDFVSRACGVLSGSYGASRPVSATKS
jgi:fructose-bisphosphate aldolase, class I